MKVPCVKATFLVTDVIIRRFFLQHFTVKALYSTSGIYCVCTEIADVSFL